MSSPDEHAEVPALLPEISDLLNELRYAHLRIDEAEQKIAAARLTVHVEDIVAMLAAARRTLGVVIGNLEIISGVVEVGELPTLAIGPQGGAAVFA